jgi:hypothetical protein
MSAGNADPQPRFFSSNHEQIFTPPPRETKSRYEKGKKHDLHDTKAEYRK